MSLFSWFSADVETGEVVAKTDVQEDGAVNRYEYTVPDDISKGHGDTRYDSMEDFINDNPSRDRDKDDEKSKDRPWSGNGYVLSKLSSLPYEVLQEIESQTDNEYIRRSSRLLLKNMNASEDFARKLSL